MFENNGRTKLDFEIFERIIKYFFNQRERIQDNVCSLIHWLGSLHKFLASAGSTRVSANLVAKGPGWWGGATPPSSVPWFSMPSKTKDIHWYPWISMDSLWISMDNPWVSMDDQRISRDDPWMIHGYPWIIHGYPWIIYGYPKRIHGWSMVIHRYPWIIYRYQWIIQKGGGVRGHVFEIF